jgi:hypothetical protein
MVHWNEWFAFSWEAPGMAAGSKAGEIYNGIIDVGISMIFFRG